MANADTPLSLSNAMKSHPLMAIITTTANDRSARYTTARGPTPGRLLARPNRDSHPGHPDPISQRMEAYEVSILVNSAANDGPERAEALRR